MLRYNRIAAAVIVATLGLQFPAFAQEDAVVAKVGDLEIRQSELDLAMSNLDPQLAQLPDEQKKVAALSGAIDVKLLVKDATAEGLEKTEDFKKRLAFITDRELHNAYFRKHVVDAVTNEEVKARYEKEVAALPQEEEIKAAHILVATEEEAKDVIKQLDGGKDFAALAKEKSTDSNKDDGGDLGWFGKGRMVPEFEEAAFKLEKGAYTKEPVKSQFGFHVIKLEDKRVAPPPAYEQVEAQVRQLVMRDKYVALIEKAKAEQKIDIPDEAMRKAYEEASKQQAEAPAEPPAQP
ncbi:peptidylprolyl isomerase [Agrobacterium rubi]|uniref:Parvulin-like PPIase n=1 Tax=Agrobacterium rubi TR3 = NBRC 13261 TaxID=1368415 RepID=A0A081CTL5_9HYPH|nr:peptidylprolyl isomerase [Agrobacterium rubi]MBP1878471.1 peptidyl-prolyl cis-trans isomerase C [Agrobacterium rubi]NTF10266.1 peptidylprolyl isomerase [Agrobacterium rubi]NTF21556.1 peptidylprolyl isomerase [Agrobacterium rubi]NTF28413.1 peptidylprolyl isomerase [Agrobacterium rubi]GAK70011.1 putative peptidyl-prolyl cis-trans isomerase [Agrobacterium rubi TR3 = NBRC 13261]